MKLHNFDLQQNLEVDTAALDQDVLQKAGIFVICILIIISVIALIYFLCKKEPQLFEHDFSIFTTEWEKRDKRSRKRFVSGTKLKSVISRGDHFSSDDSGRSNKQPQSDRSNDQEVKDVKGRNFELLGFQIGDQAAT